MNTQRPRGRRPKQYSQAERLARMMRTLASRAMTVNDLAQEFGITRRQVYRDLDRIEEEGHPLTHSDDGVDRTWQLPPGYKGLQPITLSPCELMSLYLARSHLEYLSGTPFVEDLDGVIEKVKAGLPAKTVNHLDRIIQVFVPVQRPLRPYSTRKDVLADLQKALLLQRCVVFTYQKPGERTLTEYRVDPYVLVLHQFGLYLAGRSHRAQALRLFAVERIHSLQMTEEQFEMPPDFAPKAIYKRLFGVMVEPAQTVQIRFSRDVAYLLKERKWHPTQTLHQLRNRDVILTFKAGGLDELASWVLSWGDKAQVLAPPDLRKMVAEELIAAARQYR